MLHNLNTLTAAEVPRDADKMRQKVRDKMF